jgi:hypothetical protein
MVLSKREKYIVICTIAVLALFVLDRYAIKPLLEMREQTRIRAQQASAKWNKASGLLDRQDRLEKRWEQYCRQGIYDNASETTSRVLHEVRNWSGQYGVNLSSITPDRVGAAEKEEVQEITFLVSGTGNMNAIGHFLYQLEQTKLPLRLKDIQLSTRQEAADDMSLQVRVSAIYFAADSEKKSSEAAGPAMPIGGARR